jgi:glutathione S-transferase
MIVVHHLNNSRSQRVLWLLEELQLPYEIRRYERDPQTMLAPPELRAVHPLGKSPVISDGDLTLAESGADPGVPRRPVWGRPPGHRARHAGAHALQLLMHYAEGSLMPPLLLKLVFDRVESSPMPFFAKPVARGIADKVRKAFVLPNLRTHLDFLEQELKDRDWFAGPAFTAADVQMSFPLEAAQARGGLDARRPRLMDGSGACTRGRPTRRRWNAAAPRDPGRLKRDLRSAPRYRGRSSCTFPGHPQGARIPRAHHETIGSTPYSAPGKGIPP